MMRSSCRWNPTTEFSSARCAAGWRAVTVTQLDGQPTRPSIHSSPRLGKHPQLLDMEVIARHQDRGARCYGSVSRTSLCGHSSPRTRESMGSDSRTPAPTRCGKHAGYHRDEPRGFAASDVSFVSAQRGWVLGSGQLLTTDDGALSWQPGQPGQVLSLETASRPTAYLVGQEGAGPIPPSVEVYTGTLAGRHQAVRT